MVSLVQGSAIRRDVLCQIVIHVNFAFLTEKFAFLHQYFEFLHLFVLHH